MQSRPYPRQRNRSAREREVAQLVARGLSNRDIADKLVLTERTVESHPTHIFVKLELRSRSQLTAWVLDDQPRHASDFRVFHDDRGAPRADSGGIARWHEGQ